MHHHTEWLNIHDMHTAIVMPMMGMVQVHPLLLFSVLMVEPCLELVKI